MIPAFLVPFLVTLLPFAATCSFYTAMYFDISMGMESPFHLIVAAMLTLGQVYKADPADLLEKHEFQVRKMSSAFLNLLIEQNCKMWTLILRTSSNVREILSAL